MVCRVLFWRRDGKRPRVRPGCRWDDTSEMDLHVIIWEVWNGLIWLR